MATVIENRPLDCNFFLLRVKHKNTTRMGQFYMVRSWEHYPVLSRPISVYDADSESVSLLVRIVGEGTEILSTLREGDKITLDGPYGNGFPTVGGKVAMVGGGVGIAPLYLAAKTLREHSDCEKVDIYLGFTDSAVLEDDYCGCCNELVVDIGGYVTDRLNVKDYDHIFTCGPDPMMRALYKHCKAADVPLYVSMENRMACGMGACLVCSCKTADGNKTVCKDGPVFLADDIYL